MKKSTQCSIRNCPLWKRVQLIIGWGLLSIIVLAFIASVVFIAYQDWKMFAVVFGGIALVGGILFAGMGLIARGE